MRKLLLATTAMLGGLGVVATANAQVKLNDGTTVTTPFTAAGGIGAQQPSPGNVIVHLNGAVRFTSGAYFDQGANYNAPARVSNLTPGAASPNGQSLLNIQAGPQKLSNISFGTTLRLYPGFDGVAANGLQYGGYAEIRFDQKGNPSQNSFSLNNGTFGTLFAGATSTPDIQNRTRDAAYLYQSWGYVGTPQLGIIRGGLLFTSSTMLLTGTMENFADGGWHNSAGLQSQLSMPWLFVDNGIISGANSIQYLSPQIFGFDGAITFQPNTGGGNVWSGCVTGAAGIGCDRLSSTSDPSSWSRRTNMLDIALRYRGTFGPIGLATSGGFITSGRVLPSVNAITSTNTTTGAVTVTPLGAFNTFKNLNVGLYGAQVSYGGLLVGGHVEWGAYGYQQQLEPTGGARQVSWVGGASYTLGAATFGFQWFNYHSSQGQAAASAATVATGARNQQGPFIGAQYVLAPGLLTWIGYGYTNNYQSGFNWQTQTANPIANPTAQNASHSQMFLAGSVFSW